MGRKARLLGSHRPSGGVLDLGALLISIVILLGRIGALRARREDLGPLWGGLHGCVGRLGRRGGRDAAHAQHACGNA
eukprot:9288216-Pyramimonas_sp.AAC.1